MLIPLIRASALKLAGFFAKLTEKSPVAFPVYASAFKSVKKTARDSSRNLELTFVVSTAPKRKRPTFQLPSPFSELEAGLTIAARSTLSSSLVMSWASKNTGPGASEGSRFDIINFPRLISTLSIIPRGKVFFAFFVSGFSKFQGPSGSDTRLIYWSSTTSNLIVTWRCSSVQESSTASARVTLAM